jgi:integrase
MPPELGGFVLAADAISLPPQQPVTTPATTPEPTLSPQDSVDFLLHPVEVAKGRKAAEQYLSTFKTEETRRTAEEALETLATLISGGRCDSLDFPWQQVRPYHGAAALTILKEKGAPARIEALRCRRDATRGYRVVPESYPPRHVQKIHNTLSKVIDECCELGFVSDEERWTVTRSGRRNASAQAGSGRSGGARSAGKRRLLADGEVRALVAAAASGDNAEGARDAVLFSLVYRGLKISEITSLTLDSVRFSNKTGKCNIVARSGRSGGRGRRVALTNDELICLEDWLEYRGSADGPLLCTLGRGGKVEGKRLTTALLKEICEARAEQANVLPFVPNDLSRSADALIEHRKSVRRRSARRAAEVPSAAEQVLFEVDDDPDETSEAIRFPFLGLEI